MSSFRSLGVSADVADMSFRSIHSALTEIARQLDDLDQRVRELESQWSGEARDAFDTAMRDARESLRGMQATGRAITDAAQRSVLRFHEFDRRRASAWHR